jgi:hypothetical protein
MNDASMRTLKLFALAGIIGAINAWVNWALAVVLVAYYNPYSLGIGRGEGTGMDFAIVIALFYSLTLGAYLWIRDVPERKNFSLPLYARLTLLPDVLIVAASLFITTAVGDWLPSLCGLVLSLGWNIILAEVMIAGPLGRH